MKSVWLFVILISLSGCSKVQDFWICSVLSGHDKVVWETKIESDSQTLAKKMARFAQNEGMLFGAQDVIIDYPGHRSVRQEMEICNKDFQILADNFKDETVFTIYVRSPSLYDEKNSKKLIKELST